MVSVIVPCFNSGRFLNRCLKSLVNNEYRDIEIILVNDGSTDNTNEICENWSRRDYRIKCIFQANQGASIARNNGLKKATGEYVCFVDSDDWVEKNYIGSLLKAIESESADVALNGRVLHKGESIESFVPLNKVFKKNDIKLFFTEPSFHLLRGGPVGKLFKRDIIINNRISFPKDIHYLEDAIFVLEYLQYTNKVVSINIAAYHYELHPGSLVFTVHDFATETNGYLAFKNIADKCKSMFKMSDNDTKWLTDNLLFLINRQIKSAQGNFDKLKTIDWGFYRSHTQSNSFAGTLLRQMTTTKLGLWTLSKLKLI